MSSPSPWTGPINLKNKSTKKLQNKSTVQNKSTKKYTQTQTITKQCKHIIAYKKQQKTTKTKQIDILGHKLIFRETFEI